MVCEQDYFLFLLKLSRHRYGLMASRISLVFLVFVPLFYRLYRVMILSSMVLFLSVHSLLIEFTIKPLPMYLIYEVLFQVNGIVLCFFSRVLRIYLVTQSPWIRGKIFRGIVLNFICYKSVRVGIVSADWGKVSDLSVISVACWRFIVPRICRIRNFRL